MVFAEKRKFPRLALSVEVDYSVLGQSFPQLKSAQSKNISSGGICIILFERLPVGITLEFKFTLPDCGNIIKAQGRVVWLQEFLIGENDSIFGYNAGVEFINIAENDRRKINEYVSGGIR